ncbi:MAG: dihydrofolate reductase family protein [Actinomycetota bacterium]|nr:dihydrofolate reductase family protein [Actinomycetota bacterium]
MTEGKVFADITMSLDGFVAGPDDGVDEPLGKGGDRLHDWIYDLDTWRERHGLEGGDSNRDAEIVAESFETTGAVVMGRRMFDLGEAPWGDEPPFHMPVFVLTHRPREVVEKRGGTTFTFVTDGIESTLARAREAAGGRDVSVAGGASAIRQFLASGLLDELQVHVAPLLLGGGVRLFDGIGPAEIELETTRVVSSPRVTHLRFRVAR